MKTINKSISKTRTIVIFICTIIAGFILFVLPNVFFGVFKVNGGLKGINLLFIALFQVTTVSLLVKFSLKSLGKDFLSIGWNWKKWKTDSSLGLIAGLCWTALQFIWIIPNTGGSERTDIAQMVTMFDGTYMGLFSFIALGVIGGGIAEEIYNRGYFINVLKDTFKNPKVGLYFSAILSILFFAIGHLPSDALGWFDILIPTIIYTVLFIYTERLTAPIIAHGIYNACAVVLTYWMYF